MNETRQTPDYRAAALESMADVETKRGLAAGELEVLETELAESRQRRARIALEAEAGDAEALAEYEQLRARELDLERRAEMCGLAIACADERICGMRQGFLQSEGRRRAARDAGRLAGDETPTGSRT